MKTRTPIALALIVIAAIGVSPASAEDEEKTRILKAADAVVDGNPELALRFLRDPATAYRTADALCELPWPEGLRLVVDAVTGVVTLPPDALRALADFEPEINDVCRAVRPIGAERRAALSRLAADRANPALGAVAARLLLYAGEKDSFPVVARAFLDAEAGGIVEAHWELAGKWFEMFPGSQIPGPETPDRWRIRVLRGIASAWHCGYTEDPAEAEDTAARYRRMVAEAEGPRFRTVLVRWIAEQEPRCIVAGRIRKRPAPSWLALIGDLERGRAADPPEVRAVSRRIAERLSRYRDEKPTPPPEGVPLLPADYDSYLDWAEMKMREVLGPVDEDWPTERVPLTAEQREAVAAVLRDAIDPWREWLAARSLALDGSLESFRLLLRHGDKLYDVTRRSTHPLADLAHLVTTPAHRAAVREFLARPDVSPKARRDLREALDRDE
jgi:hypothetical protein